MGAVHLIPVPSLLFFPSRPLTPASSCGGEPLQVLVTSSRLLYQAVHEGRMLLHGGFPLEAPADHFRLIHRHLHDKFDNGSTERLPYPYGALPWSLIQCNEATCHQRTVSGPGWGGVIHTVSQINDEDPKLLQRTSKAKEPISPLNFLISHCPSGA